MLLYNGNFHKILLTLTDSPHKEVQYNCAGIIGHLATNGKNIFCDSNQTTHLYQHQHTLSLSLSLSLPLPLHLYLHRTISFFITGRRTICNGLPTSFHTT